MLRSSGRIDPGLYRKAATVGDPIDCLPRKGSGQGVDRFFGVYLGPLVGRDCFTSSGGRRRREVSGRWVRSRQGVLPNGSGAARALRSDSVCAKEGAGLRLTGKQL